jgi:hypothetical protein
MTQIEHTLKDRRKRHWLRRRAAGSVSTQTKIQGKSRTHMITIEEKPAKWIDSLLKGQVAPVKPKKVNRLSRSRRRSVRDNRPLNVLGCLALVHAVRTALAANKR